MSLHRIAAPLVPLLTRVPNATNFRPTSTQLCTRCLRALSGRELQTQLSRRQIATAVAHRPDTLDIHPPPRNAGVPDTSIAGGIPQTDRSRSSKPSDIQTPQPQYPPHASIPESEAQKPRSTVQAGTAAGSLATPNTAPPSAATDGRPRRSKLRPRKAAMTLSPAAVEQLRDLLNQPDPKFIRVGVKNRGCSGLAYNLEYVDKPGTFDEAVDQDGVKVLIDSKALFSIIGSEMDWVEDKLSRRFVFKNPNITEQCGCGESFSIS